ncbi:MAG: hypothetical protein AAF429_06515 [Pseudomonadota bacterium]
MKNSHFLFAGSAVLSIASVSFAQEPAVLAPNSKVKLGYSDGAGDGGFITGSFSAPLSNQFGVQIDLGYDDAGNDAAGLGATKGAALHMFYRDPSRFLIGAYAHRLDTDSALGDIKNTRLAIETEFYLNDLTIELLAGQDKVDIAGTKLDYDLARFALGYFVTDNTRVTASYENSFGLDNFGLKVESKMALGNQDVGLFASFEDGDAGDVFSFGATFYFGPKGLTLKDTQRKADPDDKFASPSRNGLYDAELAARMMPKDYYSSR